MFRHNDTCFSFVCRHSPCTLYILYDSLYRGAHNKRPENRLNTQTYMYMNTLRWNSLNRASKLPTSILRAKKCLTRLKFTSTHLHKLPSFIYRTKWRRIFFFHLCFFSNEYESKFLKSILQLQNWNTFLNRMTLNGTTNPRILINIHIMVHQWIRF